MNKFIEYWIEQGKQFVTIIRFIFENIKERFLVSGLLFLVILGMALFEIENPNWSNLRWALIGILTSSLASMIILDAYNRYVKFNTFNNFIMYNFVQIFFELSLLFGSICSAFIKEYNSGAQAPCISKEVIEEIKRKLNTQENICFINTSNSEFTTTPDYYYIMLPGFHDTVKIPILRILDKLIPNLLSYADKKTFIDDMTELNYSLNSFLGIVRTQANAIKIWYPNNMANAPALLGNTQNIINSLNILLDDLHNFLEKYDGFFSVQNQ